MYFFFNILHFEIKFIIQNPMVYVVLQLLKFVNKNPTIFDILFETIAKQFFSNFNLKISFIFHLKLNITSKSVKFS